MSREISLLEGEEVRMKMRPHFLSFFHMYILCLVLMIMGAMMYIFFETPEWKDDVAGEYLSDVSIGPVEAEAAAAAFIWAAFLLVIGFLAMHFWLDKGGKKLFALNFLIVIIGIGGLVAYGKYEDSEGVNDLYKWFLPAISIALGVLGFFGITYYRRGFRYTLTNLRLVISRHFFTIEQRVVRYSHIEDIAVQQGVIGRIFGYGTVIPITGSGLGTGSDQSIAIAGASTEIAGIQMGAAGGSKKSMTTSKASPEDCLFGVKHPIKVREAISQYMHEQSQVTQVSKQHDTLEEMKGIMLQQAELMKQQKK